MHSNSRSVSRRTFIKETVATTAAATAMPLGQAVAAEGDWIKLFDGKTLDGWHKTRIASATAPAANGSLRAARSSASRILPAPATAAFC